MSNDQDKPLRSVPDLDAISRRLRTAVQDDEAHYLERARELEKTSPNEGLILPDAVHGDQSQHKPVGDNAAFDQKIYLFPAEFVALREELQNNHRDWFIGINPLTGTSPAHCMVFDAPQFIGYCNGATGLSIQLDTGDVAGICKKFLNGFRKLRGVGEIQ